MKSLVVILVGASLVPAQPAAPFVLLDSTPVKLRLSRNLSSAKAREGDTADFEVIEEIRVNGVVVAARGGAAAASVTEAKERGHFGKGGKLDINIDYLRLVDGERVPLRAVSENKGGGNTGKMTAAVVATSLVFWPAAPLFFFWHGKDATIPKGTELTAYINGDIRLDPAKFGETYMASKEVAEFKADPVRPAHASGLTNADILVMKNAGLGDGVIIAKIKSSLCNYQLEPPYLIQFKKEGVSEPVLQAMIEACH